MWPNLKEIKNLRKKLKLSQKELGIACGISQPIISRIEQGKLDPPYSKAKKIFEYLESLKPNGKKSEKKAKDIMTKEVIFLNSKSMVKNAVELMNQNEISQLPILEGSNNLGSITAKKIQKLIADNPDMIKINVMLIKELPFPEIQKDWDVKEISNLLVKYNAVLVKEFNTFIGIITNADFFKII